MSQVIWSKFQANPKSFFPCAVQIVSVEVSFSPYKAKQVPGQLGFLLAKDPAILHLVSVIRIEKRQIISACLILFANLCNSFKSPS